MPFPLGHTAIGYAVLESLDGRNARRHPRGFRWSLLYAVVLSNLPDLDMLAGLLVAGNGALFHRGPTHSLVFAAAAAWAAARATRILPGLPRLSFLHAFMVAASHPMADLFFSHGPVSLFWPFRVRWSSGSSGWSDVLGGVLSVGVTEMAALAGSLCLVALLRRLRDQTSPSGPKWALAEAATPPPDRAGHPRHLPGERPAGRP